MSPPFKPGDVIRCNPGVKMPLWQDIRERGLTDGFICWVTDSELACVVSRKDDYFVFVVFNGCLGYVGTQNVSRAF